MITLEQSEKEVLAEFKLVKSDVEKILGEKVNDKDYKQAIVDVSTKILTISRTGDNSLSDSISRIAGFFDRCKTKLGIVVWSQVKHKNIKIEVLYDNRKLSSWDIPIDLIFTHKNTFESTVPLLIDSLEDMFVYCCLDPFFREKILEGDDQAIKVLYSLFENSPRDTCASIQFMLKENFPDFYKYITEKLDVVKFEEISEETETSEPKKKGKRKPVKRK